MKNQRNYYYATVFIEDENINIKDISEYFYKNIEKIGFLCSICEVDIFDNLGCLCNLCEEEENKNKESRKIEEIYFVFGIPKEKDVFNRDYYKEYISANGHKVLIEIKTKFKYDDSIESIIESFDY